MSPLRASWRRWNGAAVAALGVALCLSLPSTARALITGGAGNTPITDPGWPKGAAAIFNHPGRVAWWEGPPFGGGQWHAECRGDAKTLNAILTGFAKLENKTRRVYVHDGEGQSFWLNINREPQKAEAAKIDWEFIVWVPGNWQRLRGMPADLNPIGPQAADAGPPVELHIYTGGRVRWADVVMPKGVEVVDQQLVSHGFTVADGPVFEGKVTDAEGGKPLAARVRFERVEPQPKGGYRYPPIGETRADAQGRWVWKKVPTGWLRMVVEADGFVSRVAGFAQVGSEPRWASYETRLARPGSVSGRVVDEAGKPLGDVEVRFANVATAGGERYESDREFECKTDAEGRFRHDGLPVGTATVWVRKFGHVRPGLGPNIKTPAADVALTMVRSARLRVKVEFGKSARPGEYLVEMEPEGGSKIGSWGGSSRVDDKGEVTMTGIPPGRYVLTGHPNPTSDNQKTKPVTVELKGGRLTEVTIEARP